MGIRWQQMLQDRLQYTADALLEAVLEQVAAGGLQGFQNVYGRDAAPNSYSN